MCVVIDMYFYQTSFCLFKQISPSWRTIFRDFYLIIFILIKSFNQFEITWSQLNFLEIKDRKKSTNDSFKIDLYNGWMNTFEYRQTLNELRTVGIKFGTFCPYLKPGVHNSNIMAGQKFLFQYSGAKTDMFILLQIVSLSKKQTRWKNKQFGFAGQSFRGPYVEHTWL